MTKLEELARKLREISNRPCKYRSDYEYEAETSSALKPLLDAADKLSQWHLPYETSKEAVQLARDLDTLREQLSQWRKK